jgi:hypothetical protein
MLLGVVAAGMPFAIHLLLRPRPRRIRFPAVAFLHTRLASGRRAQRLRNLWLLLLRALVLFFVVLLLAGPTCVPRGETGASEDPIACVLVVDDSWSMLYQVTAEQTLLDRACAAACEYIDTASRSIPRWL